MNTCYRKSLFEALAAACMKFVIGSFLVCGPPLSTSAQDVISGYNHTTYYRQKLLEFVTPMYNQPTVQASLMASINSLKSNSNPDVRSAADKAALANASMLTSTVQIEQQGRLLEHSIRQQLLQAQGIQVAGVNSTLRSGGLSAKVMELRLATELLRAKQEEKREQMQIAYEMRQERMANRLRLIKSEEIRTVTAKSGYLQNVLLSSMKSSLLKYGYTISTDPVYSQEIAKLTLPYDDFGRIRLQLDDEGEAVSFVATKGSSDLGKLPSSMNQPAVLSVVRDIEEQLQQISRLDAGADFYSATVNLSKSLQALENACNESIGTSQECARKGMQTYRIWQTTKDYRDRLRGLLNRLELEGSPEILKSPRGKYDPAIHGEGILPFAKFIADNGCKIAPAAPGDEASYVRLLQMLRLLEAVVGQ